MAQSFAGHLYSYTTANARELAYESPLPETQSVLHSLYISNHSDLIDSTSTSIEIDRFDNPGYTTFFLGKNIPIPKGSTLVFDKPITLNPGDRVYITGNVSDLDISISALQVTP